MIEINNILNQSQATYSVNSAIPIIEESYKSIFGNINASFLLIKDTKIIDCNQNALELFKCNNQFIIDMFLFTVSPDFQSNGMKSDDYAQQLLHNCLTGQHVHCKWNFRKADGSLFIAYLTLKNINIINQSYILAIINDVNYSNEINNYLIFSNDNFEILENINDIIYKLDPESTCLYISNQVQDVLGYSPDELIGRSILEVCYADDREYLRTRLSSIIDGDSANVEFRACSKTNNIIYIQSLSRPIIKDGIKIGLIGRATDISTQKVLEDKLNETKALFNQIIDNTIDGIIFFDLDGRIIDCNKALLKILGYYSVEELKSNAQYYRDLTPKENHEKDLYLIRNQLINRGYISLIERECIKKNGSRIYLQLSAALRYNAKGEPVDICSFVRDISNIKKIDSELKRYAEDLEAARAIQEEHSMSLALVIEELEESKKIAEQANNAKSEFLANISHEIRTPLNAILGFTEILINKIDNPKYISYLKTINTSGKTLLSIINDLLDLSKIEAGMLILHPEPVNLLKVIDDIKLMFSQKIEEKGLDFLTDFSNGFPIGLLLDEVRIRQIMFNLVGNAIKFTDSGFVKVSAYHTYNKNKEFPLEIILQVEDSGIGIPKEQHEIIFNAFQQKIGQNTKKYGGTGLGLSITKRLVEKMNGSIAIDSEPGLGTKIRIIISEVEETTPPNDIINKNTNDNIKFQTAKIIIADDIQYNRDVLKGFLDYFDFNVIEVTNGYELLNIAQAVKPNLILLDLNMPDMDGYEIAETIKCLSEFKNTQLIGLANSNSNIDDEKLAKVFNSILYKPIIRTDLINVLKKYLDYSILSDKNNNVELHLYNFLDFSYLLNYKNFDFNSVINELKSKFLPIWEQNHKVFLINRIKDFATDLQKFGELNKLPNLIEYGKVIFTNMENTNINEVKNILKIFPNIINSLNEYSKK